MAKQKRIPHPDSPELDAYVRDSTTRLIYRFLHRRRTNPPTMNEIRAYLTKELGQAPSQADRRLRDLRDAFDIPCVRIDGQSRYELRGWRSGGQLKGDRSINLRIRAQVLAARRCAQCGATPMDHGVHLVVDHMIPREWGGSSEIDNLQPLCEDCNAGKKALYATYEMHASEISRAIQHREPHRRIGELLKAFEGDWVPSELLGAVASAVQYQEDWQKRTRELRTLGWTIETRRERHRRVKTFYRATHWEPWPAGDIVAEIRRRERKAG